MQQRMRGLRAGAVLVTLALVAAACGATASPSPSQSNASTAPATAAASESPSATTGSGPRSGGSITIAVKRDPRTLSPMKDGGIEGNYTVMFMRDRLVNPDVNDKVAPALATSWDTPDPQTYIFHLRQGVKFNDGAPFTAKDAKYTFDQILSKDSEVAGNWSYIKDTKIIDDSTFEIDLNVPYPFMLEQMAQNSDVSIMPDGFMAKCGAACDTTVIGTGPFMVKDWVKGDHLTIVRNPNYWNPPEPYLDSVTFKVVPDPTVQIIQLMTGAADVLYSVPYKDVTDLKASGDITVYSHGSGTLMCMCMNTLAPPFNDIKVRQAMLLAIDREQIVKTILYGFGSVPSDLLPPWHPMHDASYPAPTFDQAKAKQLLAEAGYPDGKPLEFELRTINDPYFVDEATLIQAQLAQIGVKVTVTPMEKGAFLAPMFREPGTDPKSWQAGLEQYTFGNTFSFVWEQYAKDSYINSANLNLPGGFQDPEVERLAKLAITTTDSTKAKDVYRQLKDRLNQDAPEVWVSWADMVQAARSRVQNFGATAGYTYPLSVVWVNDGK
jgi:ABC-type transport system substrate-binding protein